MKRTVILVSVIVLSVLMLTSFGVAKMKKTKTRWWNPFKNLWEAIYDLQEQIDNIESMPSPPGPPGPAGQDGADGADGTDGKDGLHCWDLNANSECDLATEDTNSDDTCNALDCHGQAGELSDELKNLLCELCEKTATTPPAGLDCSQPTAKIVFVTSETFNGDLVGILGANGECQRLANAEGLTGNFKAWLSDDSSSPVIWNNRRDMPYVLLDGTRIADNWADLTDGSIQNPINMTEQGVTLTENFPPVRTNTDEFGGAQYTDLQRTCNRWNRGEFQSSEELQYVFGLLDRTDSAWTRYLGYIAYESIHCASQARLYCFEQ